MGVYGRCDPCSHERTWDRQAEENNPRPPIPPQWYSPPVDHVHTRAFGRKSTQCTGWRPSPSTARVKVRSSSAADQRPPEEWCRDGDGL